MQDAFLAALRGAAGFRGEAAVTTWLHRITLNAALDRVRRRKPTLPLDPTDVGLALLPMALSFVGISPFSGSLSENFGKQRTTTLGLAVMGLGNMLLGIAFTENLLIAEEFGLLLTGIGMGLATGPLTAVAVSSVGSERAGTASALINVARMVGATIGVASLGSVFACFHEPQLGFITAMLCGGVTQLLGSVAAWRYLSRT